MVVIYHIAVQSKCTIIHFDGLNANDDEYSTPDMNTRNSGQINAVPAYAASICIQMSSSSPTTARLATVAYFSIIIPAKAREYVFTGVGLCVRVCLSVCDHDN